MMKLAAALLAAVMAASFPATAAQPQAVRPPDREPGIEALAAARDLLRSTGFNDQFEQSARLASQASLATMIETVEAQNAVDLPPELEAELGRIVADHVERLIDEVLPSALEDSARIYARYFSAAELRELQSLQTNPVMIRMQALAPQMFAELSQIGNREALQRMPELQRNLMAAVQRWAAGREGRPLS